MIAELFCPELVRLHISRGHESIVTKIYMRSTVLYCDVILYFPAAISLMIVLSRRSSLLPAYNLFVILSNPSLLLIDHGHFQYNSVSIAFTFLATASILNNQDILGSICFVLALNFKQMTLYYSLVFFCVLLRKCLIQPTILSKILKLMSIGITVIATFALLWFPFCIFPNEDETCLSSLQQVLHRLFPFTRGIFEDKVANLWYALSVVYDYRQVSICICHREL
jgi:alpha-1,3-glucosyltransferase